MTVNSLTRRQLAMVVVSTVLLFPAWQVGKWLASSFWTATAETIREHASAMTLVIGKPVRMLGDGGTVLVLGTDVCPGQESSTVRALFGEVANAGQRECIVVQPTTTKVRVMLLAKGEPGRAEEWTVDRNANRVSFRNSNGSPVILAEADTPR